MEYNSSLPIYLQAANSIKQDIVTGKLSPGARLPSVRDLAVEYTINPNTVSRVYKELEMEGVCFTRRGMGTFVTEDPERVQQPQSLYRWRKHLSCLFSSIVMLPFLSIYFIIPPLHLL